ncbi:MAG: hypothetical protein IKS51_08395 [Erysipelotrichaceae bacterium]|nr:hypothetical protein [Erysipelotrichaceae bacterium]
MLKFVLVFLLAAVIEAVQMMLINKNYFEGEKDPEALEYIAHRIDTPSFGYVPGRSSYDEKHGRHVREYKYEWEYQGKKHTLWASDNPSCRYERYVETLPEDITITIHKKTGKCYVPKNEKARAIKYLLTMAVSLVISYFIVSLFIK